MDVVVHLLIADKVAVAALGLLFATHTPPTLSRPVEKAKLKSPTPLVSQSPMSPHLVVAVAVFWT